ncbi:MAG: YicC/YloC family endoribonuclease [Bacteroidota bacterium]|nr:YicC/YloC family endoribonuclease [Bacteroidota bacterium]
MKSMTGYGKASATFETKNISIEIKSLNSKQADVNIKLPPIYRSLEVEINNILKKRLERGKIDCFISLTYTKGEANVDINQELFKTYFTQLREMTRSIGANETYLTEYLLRRDDVLQSEQENLSEQECQSLFSTLNNAINTLDEYRQTEGSALEQEFLKRLAIIESLSLEISPFEKNRVPQIKEKLLSRLEELKPIEVDSSRLEQELIYYLEKLDITEEQTRLAQHIKYFKQTIESSENIGKKLGFITQEMGREINTLGSKSNDAQMQQIVVKMKDELEKIKEQLANVL